MIPDKLKLNDDKNELFLIISARPQLSKFHIKKLSVSDVSIAPAAFAKNLGIWFDAILA